MLISTVSDNVDEIICEYEGNSFSLHSELALKVAKKVTKINVEELHSEILNILVHFYINVRSQF